MYDQPSEGICLRLIEAKIFYEVTAKSINVEN